MQGNESCYNFNAAMPPCTQSMNQQSYTPVEINAYAQGMPSIHQPSTNKHPSFTPPLHNNTSQFMLPNIYMPPPVSSHLQFCNVNQPPPRVPYISQSNPNDQSSSNFIQMHVVPVNNNFQSNLSPSVQMNNTHPASNVTHRSSSNLIYDTKDKNIDDGLSPDQRWVNDWLIKLNKAKIDSSESAKEEKSLKISDAKALLQQAYSLVSSLHVLKKCLDQSLTISEDLWKEFQVNAIKAKEQLLDITNIFSDKKRLVQLITRIKRRKKKRTCRRNNCILTKEINVLRRNEINQKVDENLKRIYEADQKRKQDQELKQEADAILSEVNKKMHEGSQTIKMLTSLKKLRELRKTAAERRGLFTSKDMDSEFSTITDNLIEVMEKQMADYHAEERALKVMIECEQEDKREKRRSHSKAILNERLHEKQSGIIRSLFGDCEIPVPHDPLLPSWSYFTQADTNVESLIFVRNVWDMYITKSKDEGSRIPVTWVAPDPPSSQEWAKYLV